MVIATVILKEVIQLGWKIPIQLQLYIIIPIQQFRKITIFLHAQISSISYLKHILMYFFKFSFLQYCCALFYLLQNFFNILQYFPHQFNWIVYLCGTVELFNLYCLFFGRPLLFLTLSKILLVLKWENCWYFVSFQKFFTIFQELILIHLRLFVKSNLDLNLSIDFLAP